MAASTSHVTRSAAKATVATVAAAAVEAGASKSSPYIQHGPASHAVDLDTPPQQSSTNATMDIRSPSEHTTTPQEQAHNDPSTSAVSSLLPSGSSPATATSTPEKRISKDPTVGICNAQARSNSVETKPSRKRTKKDLGSTTGKKAGKRKHGGEDDDDGARQIKQRKDSGITLSMEDNTTKARDLQQEQEHLHLQPSPDQPKDLLSLQPEMLSRIMSFFYPSELTKFATVSKTVYMLVQDQSIWKNISDKSHLPEPKRKLPTDMVVVLAYSDLVCEHCFSLSEMKRGALYSNRPLPVSLAWNPHNEIHLCLPCRRTYFQEHPESLPEVSDQILKGYAQGHYQLPDRLLFSLSYETRISKQYYQRYYLFDEEKVRQKALEYHGGSVGIKAEQKGFVKPRHTKPRRGMPPLAAKPKPEPEPAAPGMTLKGLAKADILAPGEVRPLDVSAVFLQIGQEVDAKPVAGLPQEIWEEIFSHLYISDLGTLAQGCKGLFKMVKQLPIWKQVWTRCQLPDPKRKFKSYMAVVAHYNDTICERCHSYSYPTRTEPADRPLPIKIMWYSLKRKVLICLRCRGRMLKSAMGNTTSAGHAKRPHKITLRGAMEEYKLPREDMWDIPSCGRSRWGEGPLFDEDDVEAYALEYHGGYVGLECARDEDYPKPRRRRPKPKSKDAVA
ncbi:hypothetical protein BGX28_010006 [Mortierella sp. GBA30]|nr:hypothetical protein BGX28_010006 [Mortierella sp. GBA30]